MHCQLRTSFFASLFSLTLCDYQREFLSVKTVTELGRQQTKQDASITRQGGQSVFVNGKVVWLYDNTKQLNQQGAILSQKANSAAYSVDPDWEVGLVEDIGFAPVVDSALDGSNQETDLAHQTNPGSGSENGMTSLFGGEQASTDSGDAGIAYWPSTNPTPLSLNESALFVPAVSVDPNSKHGRFDSLGTALFTIRTSDGQAQVIREGGHIFGPNQIPFGNLAVLIGRVRTETASIDKSTTKPSESPSTHSQTASSIPNITTSSGSWTSSVPSSTTLTMSLMTPAPAQSTDVDQASARRRLRDRRDEPDASTADPSTSKLDNSGPAQASPTASINVTKDVYLLGIARYGLQLARATADNISNSSAYMYYHPEIQNFTSKSPPLDESRPNRLYLPGTFTSGDVFFSPYFKTFVMVYFNGLRDGTFYARYLNLDIPTHDRSNKDATWKRGGKNGNGIGHEDVEALVRYRWSAETAIFAPTRVGGVATKGQVHPEWFNRRYYAESLVDKEEGEPTSPWLGANVVDPSEPDGKNILLSWTVQGMNNEYGIQLAQLEFRNIPKHPFDDSAAPRMIGTSRAVKRPLLLCLAAWLAILAGL